MRPPSAYSPRPKLAHGKPLTATKSPHIEEIHPVAGPASLLTTLFARCPSTFQMFTKFSRISR
jgi:hypothetical protein